MRTSRNAPLLRTRAGAADPTKTPDRREKFPADSIIFSHKYFSFRRVLPASTVAEGCQRIP
jgi:hypothetical protein